MCRLLFISYMPTWDFAMYTIYNIAQSQVSLKGSTPSAEAQHLGLTVGEAISSLGEVCSLEVPATPRMMPPPTANPTMLEVLCVYCSLTSHSACS